MLETRWPLFAVVRRHRVRRPADLGAAAARAHQAEAGGIFPLAGAARWRRPAPASLAATCCAIVARAGFGTESRDRAASSPICSASARSASSIGAAVAVGHRALSRRRPKPAAAAGSQIGVGLRTGALGFLLAYPLMMFWLAGSQGSIKWIDNFGIQILIYVMLGWGLNIVVGLAGLLDLGYVAFYAVGAYSLRAARQERPAVRRFAPSIPSSPSISTARTVGVLGPAAARRHPRRVLGRPARLSGAAAARRLSRDRHARLRRDHPAGADQLGRPDQRLCRHLRRAAADLLRHSLHRRRRRLRRALRASSSARSTARSFSTT